MSSARTTDAAVATSCRGSAVRVGVPFGLGEPVMPSGELAGGSMRFGVVTFGVDGELVPCATCCTGEVVLPCRSHARPSAKVSSKPAAIAALHRHATIVRVRRRDASGITSGAASATSATGATLAIGATPARAARRAAAICAHIASRGTLPSGAL